MSVGKKDRSTGRFAPAFHLQCALSAPNQPLTPTQFLDLQLSYYVPEGAIVADDSPESEALGLLNSGAEIDWADAVRLQLSIHESFIAGPRALTIMARDMVNGRKGGSKRNPSAQASRGAVDEIVNGLRVNYPAVLRGAKQEVLTAALRDERAADIKVKDNTVANYLYPMLERVRINLTRKPPYRGEYRMTARINLL